MGPRVIIVDDEPDCLEIIELLLGEIDPTIAVLATCKSAEEATAAIKQYKPDIVFLDVEMPDGNGFEVLRAFQYPEFKVVFISSYDHYALRAIKFSAVDYILKPVDQEELRLAIEKAGSLAHVKDQRIAHLNSIDPTAQGFEKVILSSHKGFKSIKLSNILSIESKPGSYTIFQLLDGSQTMATKALNYYETLFKGSMLFRIHRSFMINLMYVTSYDAVKGEVLMQNGARFVVANRRRPAFVDRLKQRYVS